MGWELSLIAIPLALVLFWGLRSRARDAIQIVQPTPTTSPAEEETAPAIEWPTVPPRSAVRGPEPMLIPSQPMPLPTQIGRGSAPLPVQVIDPPVVRFFSGPEAAEETFDATTDQIARGETFDDPTSPVVATPTFEDAVTRINRAQSPEPPALGRGSMTKLPVVRAPTPALFEPRVEDDAAADAALLDPSDRPKPPRAAPIVPLSRARSPRATKRQETDGSVITSAPDPRRDDDAKA